MTSKKFDTKYVLLNDMYTDGFYHNKCVDKVALLIQEGINYLEQGNHTNEDIQTKFDAITIGINELQEYFEENGSEIETGARESIGETVEYILKYFNINVEVEEAIRERDW